MQVSPVRSTVPETQMHIIRLLGTGASAPTLQVGYEVSVTRNGAGSYRLTWANNPGKYVSFAASFAAATPANMGGWAATVDSDTVSGLAIDVTTTDETNAAADLSAGEFVNLHFFFAQTTL